MRRAVVFLLLLVFVIANVAAGLSFRRNLAEQVRQAERAVEQSPQAQLADRRAELEQLRQVVENYRRSAGYGLADAIRFFDSAAVGWDEITLGSSGEAGERRLDVLMGRGLVGNTDQLSRMDRRLGPRYCEKYRRTPTRDGKFIVTCQIRPR